MYRLKSGRNKNIPSVTEWGQESLPELSEDKS